MISIGILSFRAPTTLENTLASYKKAGLFEESNDIFAILQKSELQAEEKTVCDTYGIKAICLSENGGRSCNQKSS